MGEANKRGSFEERRKLAIDRNAREAAESAELERLRPRGKSSAQSIIAVALGVAAASLSFERKRVEPKKEAEWM
jgi:hypothetical protein